MNKRGFLSLLLKGAVLTSAAPHIFVPKLIQPTLKVMTPIGYKLVGTCTGRLSCEGNAQLLVYERIQSHRFSWETSDISWLVNEDISK